MAQVINQNKMEEEDKPFAATTNLTNTNQQMQPTQQVVQKPKVIQQAVAPVAVKSAAVAPAVAKAQAQPINNSYNVMKGLMGGTQSSAATSTTQNAIDAQKTQALGDINKEVADYKTANTASTLTPAQIQSDFNDYLADPSSAGGVEFASTLNPTTVATAPDFTTDVGYINPSQLPTLNKSGGSVGTRILDQSLISPAQQRMRALMTGEANQEISNLINKQTSTTAQPKQLGAPTGAPYVPQQTNNNSLNLVDNSAISSAQADEARKQAEIQQENKQKQQDDLNKFLQGQQAKQQAAFQAAQQQSNVQQSVQYQNNMATQQAQQAAQRMIDNKNMMDAQTKANAEAKAKNDAAYVASQKAKDDAAANTAILNAQIAANVKAKVDAEKKKALQDLMNRPQGQVNL